MKDPVDPKRVARRLRAIMADLELDTVMDLANFVGAERSQVSNWLQGYHLPPAHWMAALIDKRPGLTLDWIYRGVADALPMALGIKLAALETGMTVPTGPASGEGGAPRPGKRASEQRNVPTRKGTKAT